MPDAWVVNASSLIILSRINRLDFLENLAPTALIPAAVIAEVSAGLHRDPSAATTQQWAKGRTVPNLPLPTTVAAHMRQLIGAYYMLLIPLAWQ